MASGVAFLDGTVVNVALPAIGRSLHVGVSGLQWVLDGYLLTMGSLIVLGGSLGDLRGRRRIFLIGLLGFMVTSIVAVRGRSGGPRGRAPVARAFEHRPGVSRPPPRQRHAGAAPFRFGDPVLPVALARASHHDQVTPAGREVA
jgi:hypothetical protein